MTTADERPPVAPGEPAPDFALPAVDGTSTVSLADYRGRNPVFLSLMIGVVMLPLAFVQARRNTNRRSP